MAEDSDKTVGCVCVFFPLPSGFADDTWQPVYSPLQSGLGSVFVLSVMQNGNHMFHKSHLYSAYSFHGTPPKGWGGIWGCPPLTFNDVGLHIWAFGPPGPPLAPHVRAFQLASIDWSEE